MSLFQSYSAPGACQPILRLLKDCDNAYFATSFKLVGLMAFPSEKRQLTWHGRCFLEYQIAHLGERVNTGKEWAFLTFETAKLLGACNPRSRGRMDCRTGVIITENFQSYYKNLIAIRKRTDAKKYQVYIFLKQKTNFKMAQIWRRR